MNEELEEQAALYALDLLDGAERSAFESRLAADEQLQKFTDALRENAALLAHSAPPMQPPAELQEKIAAALRAERRFALPRVPTPAPSFPWLPWALAAGLAIGCVVLIADRAETKKQLTKLEERNAFTQLRLASLASKLASAPDATAAIVWDASRQEGVLKVSNIPANAEDRDYQLWIVDPDQKNPIDAGTFHLSEQETHSIPFKPKAPVSSATAFAVSLERKGGVAVAEGPMVLVGK